MTATIHVATFDQLDARTLYGILKLRSEVFVVEQECAYADLDGRDLEPGTRHIWVGNGEPVAYLRVLESPDGGAAVGRVCVAAAARRKRHAAMLLDKALEVVGDREMTLNAQTYAVKLYEAAGFRIDGDEFDEDGIPHVPMRRSPSQLPDARPAGR